MKRITSLAVVFVAMVGICGAATPTAKPSSRPAPGGKGPVVEVTTAGGRGEVISGELVQMEKKSLTIHTVKGDRQLKWTELRPESVYGVYSRLINKERAEDWLMLGGLGWRLALEAEARKALETAVKLDPALDEKAKEILASPMGAGIASGEQQATEGKYRKSTPQMDAVAIAAAQKMAREVQEKLKLKLREVQTEHFLIFTDWDERENGFLKRNLEGAYSAVARQFDLSPRENVFIGKLPVYMLVRRGDFIQFSKVINESGIGEHAAGYFLGRSDGQGHMVMWKPEVPTGQRNTREAELEWARVLTHEFTHAFISRYGGNHHLVTWLNEGIAEMVSTGEFPEPRAIPYAKSLAADGERIGIIFADNKPKEGKYYPVMQTVAMMLVKEDHKAFLKMYTAMKEGMEPEAALKQFYKTDYEGLEKAWRKYMAR